MTRFVIMVIVVYIVNMFGCERMCEPFNNCHDKNSGNTYKDGDVWISVNDTEQTCSECICMETKEYTVSCITLEVTNKSHLDDVRKNKADIASQKKTQTPASHESTVITDREIELSEEQAIKIRCQKGVIPTFDSLTEAVIVQHIHYFFVTRIMYCCKKASFYKVVHPDCTVVFDDLCNSQVVNRDLPHEPCIKPFELNVF